MPKSAANAKATRKEELAPDKNGLVVRSEPRHLLLTQLPPWFIAIFATIYLCGYSIEFFFYSYFGINDADSELLRMKYIETGVEFLILYLIIFLSLFFHVLNFRTMYANVNRPMLSNVILAILGFIWPLSTYMVTIFTPLVYSALPCTSCGDYISIPYIDCFVCHSNARR